jgi:hypothetical protein
MVYRKASSREQVLGLEAKEIAEPVVMYPTLRPATWVGHIVDELAREGLVGQIALQDPAPTGDGPTVGVGERRLIVRLSRIYQLSQMVDRWVEEIEYEPAVALEVVPDGAEAGELLLNGQQVLKRAEWQRDQREPAVQIEVPHVSVMKVSTPPYVARLRVEPRSTNPEHGLGGVKAADADACPGSGDEDTPGSAPEFENWAAVLACGLDVEANVRPGRVGYDAVVELRDEGSAIVSAGI